MSAEYDETSFELRPVGDELIVMDLSTNETHLLNAEAATAFHIPGMNRRALLKGGAIAGALVGAGAIQTILAPPAAAACSAALTLTVTDTGPCVAGQKRTIRFQTTGFATTPTITVSNNKTSETFTLIPPLSDCASTDQNVNVTVASTQSYTFTATQVVPPPRTVSAKPTALTLCP